MEFLQLFHRDQLPAAAVAAAGHNAVRAIRLNQENSEVSDQKPNS